MTTNSVTDALLWRRGRERLNIRRVLLTRNAIGKLKAGVVGGSPNTRDRFRGTTSIIISPHVAALNAVNVQGTSSDLFLICSKDCVYGFFELKQPKSIYCLFLPRQSPAHRVDLNDLRRFRGISCKESANVNIYIYIELYFHRSRACVELANADQINEGRPGRQWAGNAEDICTRRRTPVGVPTVESQFKTPLSWALGVSLALVSDGLWIFRSTDFDIDVEQIDDGYFPY